METFDWSEPARKGYERWVEASLAAVLYHTTHDLRSPLSAILNYLELFEEDAREGVRAAPELLERVRRSAGNALAWLDGLTPLARLGRTPLRVEEVDFDRLARSVADQHARAPGKGKIAFEVEGLGSVSADAKILECVLTGLVEWIAQSARDGERAQLRIRRRHDDRGDAVFSVESSVLHFAADRPADAFLPFSPLTRSAEAGASCSPDLKLASVAWGIYRHGGRVWAEPSASCFYFSLQASRREA